MRPFRSFYLTLIYLFLYIPIGTLIIYSFNNATFSMLWHGFTLNWYRTVLQDSSLWFAVCHSVC